MRDLTERLRERVLTVLEGYRGFDEAFSAKTEPGWPTWSQSIRIKALLDNKRILVADDTGVNGKTFTAVASKLALDQNAGKPHPTLVIAPNAGMLNAWSPEEIDRYAGYVRTGGQNVVTVQHYSDLEQVVKGTDFAVINWDKLSIRPDDSRWASIDAALDRMQPEFYVLDECHNAKGSTSLRAQTVQRISSRTIDKHLMLLSATPIPNRYRDLSMIFHLLDPIQYSSPTGFSYSPPEAMKELLDRQVWFRLTRHDLKEELGLSDFTEVEVPVVMNDDEVNAYFEAWSDCVMLGTGLTQLRKILFDAKLSKYGQGGESHSTKYEAVAHLAAQSIEEGQKVIIKSNLVEGVLPHLATRLSAHSPLIVSGETPMAERRKAYLLWRNDSKHNALLTSPVTEESVDLTTGDIPCTMISVEPEMTPRENIQFTGRVYRRGQRAPVTHYTLVSESEALNRMMVKTIQEIAEKYDTRVPSKFRPRTIAADMLAMRRAKQEIVDKIYGGSRITKHEEQVYDANEVERAAAHLEGLLSPRTFKQKGPFQLSILMQTRWRNLGAKEFHQLTHAKEWRKWKALYEEEWDTSASHATQQAIGRIVDDLEGKLGHPARIVDIGSGAAYFSRATGRDVINIDIDPTFLAAGKKKSRKRRNDYLAASATSLPLANEAVDMAINAYSLFYLRQDSERHEIEDAIIESNRVLRTGGHSIIALPYSIDENCLKRFRDGMCEYGFTESTFLDKRASRQAKMKNGCYILVHEKTGPAEPQGRNLSLYEGRVRIIG